MSKKQINIIEPKPLIIATALAVVIAVLLITTGHLGASEQGTGTEPQIDTGKIKGSADAPITIVEFSDFQCLHCQDFAETTLKELQTSYIDTGKVRLRYRHYPNQGDESMMAALAAECAAEQDRFWEYYDKLMAVKASPTQPDLTREKLIDLAREAGLDIAQFSASLDSKKYQAVVDEDYNLAQELGVSGPPVFFINGYKVEGSQPFETFQTIIDELLQEAGS